MAAMNVSWPGKNVDHDMYREGSKPVQSPFLSIPSAKVWSKAFLAPFIESIMGGLRSSTVSIQYDIYNIGS